jgi:hypothetical protein
LFDGRSADVEVRKCGGSRTVHASCGRSIRRRGRRSRTRVSAWRTPRSS